MEFITKFKLIDINKRIEIYKNALKKYPTKIPIIIDRMNSNNNILKKHKYLADRNMTIANIMYIIRKYLKINESEALFLFTLHNFMLLNLQQTIGEVYNLYSENDGYLYLIYMKENTFGK